MRPRSDAVACRQAFFISLSNCCCRLAITAAALPGFARAAHQVIQRDRFFLRPDELGAHEKAGVARMVIDLALIDFVENFYSVKNGVTNNLLKSCTSNNGSFLAPYAYTSVHHGEHR